MSYKSLDLDFSDWKIVCISGHNGSGKSTLLDSITWALWKKARTSSSEQLIHLGEKELSVIFTFQINQNIYRVIRTLQKTSKGSTQSTLELQVLNNDQFVTLTGKGVDDAQKKINEIMGMDYQTFINSTFFLQGRIDEFTTKTPVERKKILSDILELEIYDKLKDLAKQERDKLKGKVEFLKDEITYLEQNLNIKQNLELELQELQSKLINIENDIKNIENEDKFLKDKKQKLIEELSALNIIEQNYNKTKSNLMNLEKEIYKIQDIIENTKEKLNKREEIELNYNKLKELQKLENELSEKLQKYLDYDNKRQQIQKEIELEANKLNINIQKIEERLKQLDNQRNECNNILEDKDKILLALEKLKEAKIEEQNYINLAYKYQEFLKQKNELEREFQKITQNINIEIGNLKLQIDNYNKQIQTHNNLLKNKEEIEKELEEISKLEVQNQWITENGININKELELLEQNITKIQDLIKEKNNKLIQINTLAKSECPLCERELNQEDKEKIIKKYNDELLQLELELQNIQQNKLKLEVEREQLRERYKIINNQLKSKDLLQQKLGEINQGLNNIENAKKEIEDKKNRLIELEKELKNRISELNKKLTNLDNEIKAIDYNPEKLAILQAKVADLKWAEIKYAQLEQAKEKIEEIKLNIINLQNEHKILKENLSNQNYALEAQEKLKEIVGKIELLNYDRQYHQQIKEQINSLQIYEIEMQNLLETLKLQEQLDKLIEQRDNLYLEIKAYKEKVELIPELLKQKDELINLINIKELELKEKFQERRELDNRIAILQSDIQRLNEQLNILNSKKNEYESIYKKITHYEALINVFGKNGIQAVIIENVLPEIENDANAILSKLTDGRMHVTLTTQKESKTTDKVSETLDIYISDELGTRNYELYSGGEMFRINFAIRLALSKLLARRSGTKLEMLFIDEGFGSLDINGQSRLIEIINLISKEFDKIIIITHIQELKDYFPQRIEIYKENNESKILVFK